MTPRKETPETKTENRACAPSQLALLLGCNKGEGGGKVVNNQENRRMPRKGHCPCRRKGVDQGLVFPQRPGPGHGLAKVSAECEISQVCCLQTYPPTAIDRVLPAYMICTLIFY